jgi:hypothetical protein
MKRFSLLLAIVTLPSASASAAQSNPVSVSAPQINEDDSWIFERTRDRGRNGFSRQRFDLIIQRVSSNNMIVGVKPDGSPADYVGHMCNLDWSQAKIFNGKETPTGRPFSFPLTAGKTWTSDFTDPRAHGTVTSLHFHNVYKVVGWQDITVQAGKFRALKIEMDGTMQAHTAATATVAGGAAVGDGDDATAVNIQRSGPKIIDMTNYGEFYYVPSVKYFVKSVEEQYNTDNVRVRRDVQELVSFKPHS